MTLNDTCCFFLKKHKQLNQDEIIEILDQAKTRDPEWHGEIVYVNFDIFDTSYKESVSYFKCLENLEKIRHINDPILLQYQ
jgi:hypothetical protein